jgi:hypothetical protein
VQYAAKTGRPVIACTRGGSFSTGDLRLTSDEADLVTAKPGDVSKATSAELVALLIGAGRGGDPDDGPQTGAVIFAASASPNGGTPQVGWGLHSPPAVTRLVTRNIPAVIKGGVMMTGATGESSWGIRRAR